MWTASTVFSWVLAVAPPATFDTTSVSDIQVASSNEAAEILVYDDEGEVSATLVIWLDADQRLRLDADFADGLYLSTAVVDGEDPVIESNNREEVAERLSTIMSNADALDDGAHDGGTTTAGIGSCAWSAVGTASACAAARPIFCVVGAAVMACNCLPLLVDEWEGYSCPGFG